MPTISKLELHQTQVSVPRSNNKSIFLKSSLETEENVQTGGKISGSSSDEENEQLEIQVGKSQRVF